MITPNVLWSLVKQDFLHALGDSPAAFALLGTALSYPFHEDLREAFQGIPAAWIHGPAGSGKTTLAHAIHHFYTPDPVTSLQLCRSTPPEQPHRHLLAYHHLPVMLDDWNETATDLWPHLTGYRRNIDKIGHNIVASFEPGYIDRGIFGTITFRREALSPPLVVSESVSRDPATASRFLHFQTTLSPDLAERQTRHRLLREHLGSYHLVLSVLLTDRRHFLQQVTPLIRGMINELPETLNYRQRITLAAAWGIFTAIDNRLGGTTAASRILRAFLLENPTALLNSVK